MRDEEVSIFLNRCFADPVKESGSTDIPLTARKDVYYFQNDKREPRKVPQLEETMAILRQIAQLGQPVLREPALAVADPADPAIQSLIDDMLVTVAEANGVGIAAPQVYQPLALFIVAARPTPRYPNSPAVEPVAMLNPELLSVSEEMEMGWEGCLSIPGIRGLVPRHRAIRVRYLTRLGELREEEYEGFLARIFQHEFDHIRGIVFLDRAESRDLVTEKEYLRMIS